MRTRVLVWRCRWARSGDGPEFRDRFFAGTRRSRAGAPARAPSSGVTFTETIAPILYANCVTCHRPGEAAPFSLISYEDVAKRADLIAEVTGSRYMPPWHAAHGYGEFVGERRLSDAQIAAIGAWVNGRDAAR